MDLIVGYFKCEIRVLEKYLDFVAGKNLFPSDMIALVIERRSARQKTARCFFLFSFLRGSVRVFIMGGNWEEGKIAFRKLKSRAFGK